MMKAPTTAQRAAPGRAPVNSKQLATMLAAMTKINPHLGTMLILFASPLLHKRRIFWELHEFKEHMHWVRLDSSDDDTNRILRCELQELNKQAGVHFIR